MASQPKARGVVFQATAPVGLLLLVKAEGLAEVGQTLCKVNTGLSVLVSYV